MTFFVAHVLICLDIEDNEMDRKTPCLILFAALLTVCFSVAASGQVFEGKDGRRLAIEIVQEPPCPVKISVERVALDSENPDSELIILRLENLSTKPIRAYSMVSGGDRHPNMHTVTFPGKPFDAGTTMRRSVWPNSQEHYYFFFDHILFTDGTTCGNNNHYRSIQIANFLEAWDSAMSRLKTLVANYEDPDFFVANVEKGFAGGFNSFDNPGPPNPETIRLMPRRAYEHVISQLRQLKGRESEAREAADRLEKEIPGSAHSEQTQKTNP
jgi:hypothetical protein